MKYLTAIPLIFLIGCLSHPYIRHHVERTNVDGSRTITDTKASLPNDSRDPSVIQIGAAGVTADISGTHKPDIVAKQTTKSGMAMASMFALGAVVLLIGRFKFPFIPLIAPVACACAAVAFFTLPTILDRYSMQIAIAGAIVLIWAIYETWHQRRLHTAEPGESVGLTQWLKNRNKEQ